MELFLAGKTRRIDAGAQFAVHAWLDNYGRQPWDFAEGDPANRLYLDYYQEMGMSAARAKAFYAMTNSVPHASALWLKADDMRQWIIADTFIVEPAVMAEPTAWEEPVIELERFEVAPRIAYESAYGLPLANYQPFHRHAFLDS